MNWRTPGYSNLSNPISCLIIAGFLSWGSTYVTSGRYLRVGTRRDIQSIVPSRLKGDGDVRIVVNRRANEIRHVVDVLLELVVDPRNRVSGYALTNV